MRPLHDRPPKNTAFKTAEANARASRKTARVDFVVVAAAAAATAAFTMKPPRTARERRQLAALVLDPAEHAEVGEISVEWLYTPHSVTLFVVGAVLVTLSAFYFDTGATPASAGA